MITNFTVFGCCASRDVFNSQINFNYKDFFKIGNDAFHMSMISLMNNSVNYDEELVNTFEGEISDYNLGLIKKDLDKSFLNDLKNDKYEYMLLDTYFDVMHGVIRLNDENTFITNTKFVHQTEFYKNINNKDILTIKNNPIEYLKLWTECCNKFFSFVQEHCPNMKIILNPVRSSIKANDNGNIIEHEYYKRFIPNHCYRSILDEYILNNYDVDVLIFEKQHLLDENHAFGPAEIHYEYSYFKDITDQLNEIISNNQSLDPKTLQKIRFLKRKYMINEFNIKMGLYNQNTVLNLIDKLNEDEKSNKSIKTILNSKIIDYWDQLSENGYTKYYNLLNKYMTARLDIKNYGNENNGVNVLDISDSNSLVIYPNWLKNNEGAGAVVQSDKCRLHFKIKCINKGNLIIDLKGPDVKDRKRNNIPIYIDYTSLKINGKEYVNKNLFTNFDKSFEVNKFVEDSEIVDVEVKWMPLNSSRLLD